VNRILVERLPAAGGLVTVDPTGSHHLLRVQRVPRDAPVHAADRHGQRAACTLLDVRDGAAILRVDALLPATPQPGRVVLLGLPKPAAVEEALTAGTEAGATAWRLVRAERSPPGTPRPDRLERVLRAAVTQCGRGEVPEVTGPLTLADALLDLPARRFVGSRGGAALDGTTEDVAVAIGPEGGWSPDEERALVATGFVPVDLGPFVLRTPTAVVAALARLWSVPGP
jgi:16S rRNA (uracil1498-N3)-methyltransferase